MTDFQAICVDDCSADDSAAILQEYAEADNRFAVVRLSENHGQAYARNEALKLADSAMYKIKKSRK
jgi:glycosyltransferase involved in cell wall biosynthesis